MNSLDNFWYRLCFKIKTIRDYDGMHVSGIRTYNLKHEHFKRVDYDKDNAYIMLSGGMNSNIVSISKYDYAERIRQIEAKYKLHKDDSLNEKLEEYSDDVLSAFILSYLDKII